MPSRSCRRSVPLIAVLTLFFSPWSPAQSAETAVDVGQLMSGSTTTTLRFYDQAPSLMVSDVVLVFRPDGDHNTRLVVIDDDDEEVATLDFFPNYQWSDSVFAKVRPKGPGVIQLPGEGEYAIQIFVNDDLANEFPFEVIKEDSGDPFKPDPKYHYLGQWQELAYLRESKKYSDQAIEANIWVSALDMPDPDGKGDLFVKLYKDGDLVARNKRALRVNKRSKIAGQYSLTLHDPVDNPNAPSYSFERLLAEDEDFELTIEIDGKDVRSFEFEVDDNEIEPIERSEMGHSPHEEYLPPRTIAKPGTARSNNEAEVIHWLEAD